MAKLALTTPATPTAQTAATALQPAEGFPLLFRVPDEELHTYWNDLKKTKQRNFVTNTFEALEEIHLAKNRKAKAQEIESRHFGADGFGWKTLVYKHRLYTQGGYKSGVKRPENYVRPGDWRALVPDYWLPEKKHDPRFLDFIAQLAGNFQRDQGDAAAIRHLKFTLWPDAANSIPGVGTWKQEFRRRFPLEPIPQDCPPDFWPSGWSDRQLYRLLPEAAHMEIVRHGVAAGEEHFAQILNDRTKLHFGQIIIIDDFWAPFKVAYGRSIDYCVGLAAIDWASGAWVHHDLMPRERLPDGKRRSLTAAHMQGFIVTLLRALGHLPKDRTITLLVENNTASVSTELADVIRLAFNGRVIVKRSGLLDAKQGTVLDHGFTERGGKWRAEGKGLIESGLNLFKNEASGLIGQRGSKERTNGHAADPDKENYAVALLQNEVLTAAHIAQLKLPYLTFDDARAMTKRIFEKINGYRDHKCRGFLHLEEWRMSEKDNWTLYGTPATPEQQVLLDAGREPIRRTKPESRLMRAVRLRNELEWTPIDDAAFVTLSADRMKPVVVTAKKQIVITRAGADSIVFYSARAVAEGLLTPGREYRAFYFDDEPAAIHLTPKDSLDYLGSVARFGSIDPTSEEERGRAYAETLAPKRAVLAGIKRVHAQDDANLAAMRTHNDAVVNAAKTGRAMAEATQVARAEAQTQTAADRRKAERRAAQRLAAAAANAAKF